MSATSLAAWMTGVLVAFAIIPTVYVLAREALRRRYTRAAVERVAEATRSSTGDGDIASLASNLRERFDGPTRERAVEQMMRSDD